MRKLNLLIIICLLLTCTDVPISQAKEVLYDLSIGHKTVNFTGKDVKAMAINDSIPGPTLKFVEGDLARIRMKNNMDVPTSVHWHGVLLPNRQDGVPFINNPPIEPGETREFKFTIKQTGTYWYHSHTGLQEQRGIYGSIVIVPKDGERIASDREEMIVLSDWTDENPDEVMRTLKSGSDYYSFKKGSLQTLFGAVKEGALTDVFKRSLLRMPPMDVSDVAYDRFLVNGSSETAIPARPGEKIRLRLINAATATYFYLQFAGGPLRIVSADGQDTEPVKIDRFLMAIAETYDLIVTVPEGGSYELRATAQDGSGHTSVFIGNGKRVLAPDVPKPHLYKMKMSMGDQAMDGMSPKMMMSPKRPKAPYEKLRALRPTTLPKDYPVREIVLNLTGDMERFIWSMNGETLSPESAIRIRYGENVRFKLVNKTMMHHPMHLHGHFFRVINGQGDHAPLKHTVNVPPMSTQVIEFEGNEHKDWFFHCHVLYHAIAGMARIVGYEDHVLDPDLREIRHKLFKDPFYFWFDGTGQSHMTDGEAVLANSKHIFSAHWEVGWQWVEETEYDAELDYDYYVNRFLTAYVGGNFTNEYERAIFGIRYLLPFNIHSALRIDSAGEFRVSLRQDLQVTRRFVVFGDFEYDTESEEEWKVGGAFLLSKHFSLVGQYHSDFGAGAGFRFRY